MYKHSYANIVYSFISYRGAGKCDISGLSFPIMYLSRDGDVMDTQREGTATTEQNHNSKNNNLLHRTANFENKFLMYNSLRLQNHNLNDEAVL